MNFQDAVKICFQKYADFNGRATRPEFWWFYLFVLIVSSVLGLISHYLSAAFSLATTLPYLAVGSRRLHDINKSGWLQLVWFVSSILGLIVLIGAMVSGSFIFMAFGATLLVLSYIYMIYLSVKVGDAAENQYGDVPTN